MAPGDRFRRNIPRIGQTLGGDAGFLIKVKHCAPGPGHPFETDLAFFRNAGRFPPTALGTGDCLGVVFHVCHEEAAIFGHLPVPGLSGIAPFEHNLRPLGPYKFPGDRNLTLPALGRIDQCRGIRTKVHFGSPLVVLNLAQEKRQGQHRQ